MSDDDQFMEDQENEEEYQDEEDEMPRLFEDDDEISGSEGGGGKREGSGSDDDDMHKPGMEDQRRKRGKYHRRRRTSHDHEPTFKQEDDDMEDRMAKMKGILHNMIIIEMAIDMKRLDLTRHQHSLVKEMAADLINNFDIPDCGNILSRMKDMVKLMMRTRDHKIQFEALNADEELMEHLNNCKEDLYK